MNKERQIPIVNPIELEKLHFGSIDWRLPNPNSHQFFHINRIEDYVTKLTFPLPPHRKTVYDFIFLTNGKSVRTKGLNQFEFGTNDFFFLPAYQITTHEWMSDNAEGFFVHFSPQIFKDNDQEPLLKFYPFLDYQTNPVLSVSADMKKSIVHILSRLEEIYTDRKLEDFRLVVFYLTTLFEELSVFYELDSVKSKTAAGILTLKYKEALSQQIYNIQKVSEYANLLNVSPNHLNKCIKTITGKSAQILLNEMLILEAKSLLKYSNLNIAEIAVKLFNQTPSNFSRFFKSQTGITPKEYYS